MRAKKARQRRRQQREHAEALARGDVQPTRAEKIRALRLQRDARLAQTNAEFTEALNELYGQLSDNKKAIWADYHATVERLSTAERVADLGNVGIVVAPAATDLDKLAGELVEATGRPVRR